MLDYLLSALKIAGVLGAFLGLANLPEKSQSVDPRSRKQRNLKMALALIALLVAIGAEVVDFIGKKQDAAAQTDRYYRLMHPLGTIQIDAVISVKLTKPFAIYTKELDDWAGSQPNDVPNPSEDLPPLPTRKNDPASYALLQHPAEMSVALFKTPIIPQKRKTSVPDLDFLVSEAKYPGRTPVVDKTPLATPYDYSSENKTLLLQEPSMENLPSSRSSTGEITVANDLLGSQIAVQICPVKLDFFNDVGSSGYFDEFAKSVELMAFTLSLPGRHEIVHFNSQAAGVVRLDDGDCKTYFYTIATDPKILQQQSISE